MNELKCEIKPDWAGTWERGILNAWSRRLIVRHGSIREAWNCMSVEYDKDMKHSNRAQFVDRIEQHCPETVLDVGAGTGVFAVPLSKKVKRVVAVEPSPGMLDILKNEAAEHNSTNIECVNKKWEDVSTDELLGINSGGKFDVVICSHALYYITNLHQSFQKMNDVSRGHVFLFTEGGADDTDKADYSRLWERLHKEPLPAYPDYSCLYMVLREIGIHPNIEMLDTYSKREVKNVDEVMERWKDYFDFDGEPSEDQRDAIRAFITGKIKEEDGKLYLDWRSRDALIYWRAE